MFKPILNNDLKRFPLAEKNNQNDLNDDDESESDDSDFDDATPEIKKPSDVQNDCAFQTLSQQELRDHITKNRIEEDDQTENCSVEMEEHYVFEENPDQNQFEIELGSSKLPRISCANHKLNLAVRKAMSEHQSICADMKKLNSFISRIRSSYNLDRVFQNLKCRLRIENNTRWSSAFLSLETIIRAIIRKAIQVDNLPVRLSRIETYFLILQPAYNLNISFQSNNCSIGDVFPAVLSCLEVYEDMEVSEKTSLGKSLCKLLHNNIKQRFDFEFNSNIYHVFKTKTIHTFFKKGCFCTKSFFYTLLVWLTIR